MLGFVPAAIDASAQLPARSRTLSAFAQCRASLRPTYNTRARPSTQRGARVGPAKRVAREREAMGDHGDPQASERLPTLIAFDLDGTLWMPEMDMLMGGPPFKPHKNPGTVVDSYGTKVGLIGHSHSILQELATHTRWQDTHVAYVSRTEFPEYAFPCLQAIEVCESVSMFDLSRGNNEIFPGRKTQHFRNLHQKTGVALEDMLFFDNERRNIDDCKRLGITCIYTPYGMTMEAWEQGLQQHRESKQTTDSPAPRNHF